MATLVFFLISASLIGCVKGDNEPNNQFNEAEIIEIGSYNGTLVGEDSFDYYYIELDPNAMLNVELLFTVEDTYGSVVSMTLYDEDRVQIEYVDGAAEDGSTSMLIMEGISGSGIYYIKIETDNEVNTYNLTLEAQTPTGSLEVYILDNTDEPIVEAFIESDETPDGQPPLMTITDDHGFAKLDDLLFGHYILNVSKDGYEVANYSVDIDDTNTFETIIRLETTEDDGTDGNDDTGENNTGIPGFPIASIITAFCVSIILIQKR